MAQVIALAMQLGWAHPQAEAIAHYAWNATHLGKTYSLDAEIDPCAASWRGEGLVDATGNLRGELRRFPRQLSDAGPLPQPTRAGCVAPEVQLSFLKEAFKRHYPECSARFDAGDLGALQRCWGSGHSR